MRRTPSTTECRLAGILILCAAALCARADGVLFPPVPACNVTLAWNPSGFPDVVGYTLYWGTASETYTNTLRLGNVTTGTISNLALGTTYYFAATATSALGYESDFSNEVTYTTGDRTPPPLLMPVSTLTVQSTRDLALLWWDDVFQITLSQDQAKEFYRLKIE